MVGVWRVATLWRFLFFFNKTGMFPKKMHLQNKVMKWGNQIIKRLNNLVRNITWLFIPPTSTHLRKCWIAPTLNNCTLSVFRRNFYAAGIFSLNIWMLSLSLIQFQMHPSSYGFMITKSIFVWGLNFQEKKFSTSNINLVNYLFLNRCYLYILSDSQS